MLYFAFRCTSHSRNSQFSQVTTGVSSEYNRQHGTVTSVLSVDDDQLGIRFDDAKLGDKSIRRENLKLEAEGFTPETR